MLPVAQRAQPLKGLMLGTPAPAHQDPDSPVDDAAKFQSQLQLVRQPPGLCEDMGVVYGDCGRRGEDLAKFGGPVIKGVLAVGVDVHRADHPGGGNQWTTTPRWVRRAGRPGHRTAATGGLRRVSPTRQSDPHGRH